MHGKPDGQIEDHTDDGGGDRAQRTRQRLVVAQPLNVGRAQKDPQEAGRERDPGCEQPAEHPGSERRERAGIAKRPHKADELQHHDQRAGRCFRHAEAVQHFAGLQPVKALDRLLCDIGQHRIGTAEGDNGHFREEQRDLRKDIAGAQRRHDDADGRKPQDGAGQCGAMRVASHGGRLLEGRVAEQGRAMIGAARPAMAANGESGVPLPAADKANQTGSENHEREGDMEGEERDEGERRDAAQDIVLQRAFPHPHHGFDNDGEHGGFQAEEQRGDNSDRSKQRIDDAERHDGQRAGQDEEPASEKAAFDAMHQPADIGRKLLRLGAGQEHAIIERMQKARLGNPAPLVDEDAVHHRDLSCRPAKRQGRDARPDAQRLAQCDPVCLHGAPPLPH